LEKLENSHDVEVIWRAFELRPKGSPPMPPEYRARIQAGRPRLMAIAREHYGLELQQGPFGIDSRPALIGAKYAESQGAGVTYHWAVFRAYWQEAQDIGDPAVLAQIAQQVGLDPQAFTEALADPVLDGQVQDEIDQAHAYGLNGVPAMVFAEKYLVSGAQPYPVLVQVVEQVQAEQRDQTS
jgi:predicted DsbA family dithiol-disulfide isomerase